MFKNLTINNSFIYFKIKFPHKTNDGIYYQNDPYKYTVRVFLFCNFTSFGADCVSNYNVREKILCYPILLISAHTS